MRRDSGAGRGEGWEVGRERGGGCRSPIKSTHTGNTCDVKHFQCVVVVPVYIWEITRANEGTLGQSDFCPFASQGFFCSDRLVGLVVKASASRAEDPWFESRLRRDFFRGRVIP